MPIEKSDSFPAPNLHPDLQDCIEARKIAADDIPRILRILELPKNDLIANFHNTFTPSWGTPDSVRKELQRALDGMKSLEDEKLKELFGIMIELCGRYDLYALYHLERVLEEVHS